MLIANHELKTRMAQAAISESEDRRLQQAADRACTTRSSFIRMAIVRALQHVEAGVLELPAVEVGGGGRRGGRPAARRLAPG